MNFKIILLVFGLAAGTVTGVARAQDPPSRVARLNYLSGSVSMQPAGTQEWSQAVVNRPFTTGDYLWADVDSKAEFHLNDSTVRINSETSVGFLNLDDRTVQIRLAQGELAVHLTRLGGDEAYEIDTPNAAITLLRNGDYRITVDANALTSFVVVRHGQAEITGGGQALNLPAGQSAQLSGTDAMAYDVEVAPGPDGFENFCASRDAREQRIALQSRYAPTDMIGYEDLQDNGAWREVPTYGWVWYPRVTVGWAPYRVGHWAWIEPWGWTWVDDAPWGFAPFHYGRWAYAGGGWCWMPGPHGVVAVGRPVIVERPVYAPALVAFFGGPHFSVSLSVGGGGLAWVPLGPGEVYTPAYRVSPNYFRQVNVSNTTINKTVNITNVYNTTYVNKTVNVTNNNITNVNQRFVNVQAPGAVTAMPQNAFASGRPVASAGQTVPREQVARMQGAMPIVAPPVAPTRQALAPLSNGPAARPPAAVMMRQVVARQTPAPAPVPFAARQQYLQQNAGQPVNTAAVRPNFARPANTTNVRPAIPAGTTVQQVQTQPGSRSAAAGGRAVPPQNGGSGNYGGPPARVAVPRPPAAYNGMQQQQVQPQPPPAQRVEQRPMPQQPPQRVAQQPTRPETTVTRPPNQNPEMNRPANVARPPEQARPENREAAPRPPERPAPNTNNRPAREEHPRERPEQK